MIRDRLRSVAIRVYLFLAAVSLFLSGCTHAHPQFIPVTCKFPAERTQPFAADTMPADADIFTQVKTLLIDRQERKIDRTQLTTAIKACKEGPTQ